MADRGVVHYEEVKDVYANDYPSRGYFSHIIDVILINLNERDSINKIKDNPAHHNNKDNQLAGIDNKSVETALNNAKNSINNTALPLRASDVNVIIENTEDLASTVAKPTTSTRVVECQYYQNGLIVPTSYTPDHTSDTYSTLQITIGTREETGIGADSIKYSGYSKLDSDYMQEITGYEIGNFGQLQPDRVVANNTYSATIAAIFTYGDYNPVTLQFSNPKTVMAFSQSKDAFPQNISDGGFGFGISADPAFSFSIEDLKETEDGRISYYVMDGSISQLLASEGTVDEVYAYLSINDAMEVAEEAIICTNPGLECENRRQEYGYNKINESSPGYVWVCTNTSRIETYTITAGTAISISRVKAGDVVYASTFTTIAQYLRQVSQALDGYGSWWDPSGHCARNCQVACQETCQLSCQHCVTSTCHNQNCGFS